MTLPHAGSADAPVRRFQRVLDASIKKRINKDSNRKNLHYLLITEHFEFSDFNSGFQYTDCINYTKSYVLSSSGAQWLLLKESTLQ